MQNSTQQTPPLTMRCVCPQCLGEGSVEVKRRVNYVALDLYEPIYDLEPCDLCKAKGWITFAALLELARETNEPVEIVEFASPTAEGDAHAAN